MQKTFKKHPEVQSGKIVPPSSGAARGIKHNNMFSTPVGLN